jgi:LPS export ABC transporter protein LptC
MRSAAQRRSVLTQRLTALAASGAGLVLLYGLFVERDESDVEQGPAVAQRGYYVTDATLTEMGPNGRPRVVVHAKTIEQQLNDQSVQLSDLVLDYTTQDFGPWHLTARNGHMPSDRQSLLLTGDVTITGQQPRGAAVIRTDHLAYHIDSSVVETADPVAVRFGAHELNARGLRAVLNAGTLKLESNVNGRFTP